MERLQDRKQVNNLIVLFTLTYMISYITRINFGAIISEMERATKISRSLLSMSLTGSFITYGTGQIISGIMGDKISPKKLVSLGFVITIVMNLLIPVCTGPYMMLAVWCINGFAQSFMWPPLVKLMTSLLSDADYNRASLKVSWGSSFGTIFVYLASPLLISVAGWKFVFFFCAAMGLIMLIVWNRFSRDVSVKSEKKEKVSGDSSVSVIFSPVILCVMLAIVLQGMLRDGVTTWMPSYISDTYNLSSVISIPTGVLLPIFSIVCFHLSERLYNKVFTNPLKCAGIIFGAGAFSALMIQIFTGVSAAMSVVFSAALTGSMHGVNLMLICMVPAYFKKGGNVSTVSGVLNSCTYIGSAIYTYGAALISDNFGWGATVSSWTLIAIVGTVVCLAIGYPLSKKTGIFE